ncbi:tandem-95 repeat protein [Vibrio parahaemolyticus]|uniref:tandem-95 repeat protein n=7 Tax=Gammaproteobacteria TaxID=1236 RepID=UPI0012F8D0F7|nr:tandem-95 repeat protein [Vibrio parahaemolyticus]MUT61967.1 tandem-95 repeat protein [Vibrio parahaemolyticus]UJW87999.1 tandem-95 repeat protein [Vibrio parahaemolyticus]UJX02233.1 tandem-95 repeat protein [Vibrio parahaemolyticus]WCZ06318.1 tandem-95 repeat protein [Vibrio parahaemolyticus]WCZ11378.1 tandem-95 repeat protein [Vibrio parahaemolyticus]
MDRTALVSLGNQVVVIGLDGKLRVLTEGQQPLPGEVVVTSTDVGPLDLNVQLTQEQGSKDVTDDVLQIISAIEQGQDPSVVDEEFAPAAGENGGSSLQTSATIVRDGTELLASTSFETIGIESLGLSQTQVLALNDLFRSNLQTSADSTDKPLATTPVTLDAIEEDGGSIIITTEELLSNVDDEDKDTLSVENLIIDKGNGTLVDNGDGTWTFTPQIDDDTEVSFTFDIIDDEDLVVSGSANLDILPINDAPNAKNDVITTEEDTAVTIDVLVNDSDVEGDVLSIQSASVPSEQGSVDIVDGKLVFTPAENFNGEATITYIVTDGDLTDEAKVTVTVTPVNDSPVAVDDTTSIQEDTTVTIDVLTNDTDVDGDKLSIESASVPKEQGTVEVVDGKLVFTPAENFNGDAEITYTVTDGELTDEAKVTVTVNPVNDAPTIKVDAVESITEDAVSTDTVVATLTVRDTDTSEDQLTVSLKNNSNGYFVLVGDEVKLTQAGVDAVNNDELNLKDLTISASVSDGVNPTANDSDSLIVNRVNDAPTVENAIADQVLSEDFDTYTIDLNEVFKDTDSSLEFSVSGNNSIQISIVNGVATISPTADWNGSEALTFTATDPSGESVSQTVNFTVAPVADIVADKATVVEDTPTIIKVLGNDTFEGDDQVVSLDTNNGPANGTVSVNPDGSVTYTPNDNYHGTDSFTYIVTSGGVSESTTVSVDVTPVNDAPVAKDDTAITDEDTPVTIDVLPNDNDNDNDIDGDKLSIQSASVPEAQGKVEIVDGKLVFTPAENFNGHAEIIYTVTDGQLTDEAKVTVTVNPVNDAPTIKVDAVESITEDAVSTDTVVATLTVRDTDTSEDQLTVSLENNSNGYFVLVGDEVKLTQAGVDAVNNDELNLKGLTISASVSDGVNPTASDSDSLIVNRVNDAPTIKVDAVESITEDAVSTDTVVATLTVRDTDTPEDQLTVSLENNSNGYFVLVGNEVKLTQAGVDAVNNDELNLKDLAISASVSDGVNPTASDSDSLVVNRVNDAPTVENAIADQVLSEDFDAYTIDLNEVFKDSDSSLEFSVSGNSNVLVSIENGIVTISPTADWNGSEILTFKATDPSGESISQTVNFTVAPVADIVADKATVVEDTPTIIKVLGNDTFEGDGKVVSLDTNNGPANGTVSVNPDGSVTYTPNDNYVGKDTFTYVVTSGGVSESTAVEVNVTPVNDAPVAKDDIATTQEDTAVTIDVLPNDTDVDGDKLSIQSASVPEAQGKVEIVDGKLVFTPAENFNGHAEIIYTVTDGELTDEAKVTVTVNPVNDAPTIKVDAVESITEDAVNTDTVVATLTVRDTDTPEEQLTVSLENNSNGYFVLVGNEVKLTQAGVDAVNNDELNLKDLTISASVSDGVNPTASDSDSLIVNRVNDAPTVENAIADQVLSEDFDTYTIDLNDVFKDSDSSLEFSVSGNDNIQISIVNGVATITPTADWNGSETLTFTATDPSGESVSQTVDFTVAPVVDIEADSADVVEGTPTIINVLGNDTFESTDKVVSLDADNGPKNGTVIVNNDGTVTYTPDDNYVGEDTFTYIVTSGGMSESTTVEVNVTPVNDAPVAKDDIATTQEDTAVTIDVLPNDTDVDGDKLSIQSATVPEAQGKVEIVDGKLVFTPAENFNGDAEITYTLTDGALTDQATVKVTVNAVNDTPVVESNIADQALAEDFTPYTIDLNTAFSDVDNVDGELTFSVSGNSNIQVAIVNGIATITPTADWNGSETLTFTATDPSGESISQTVNFTVAPVADIVADKATVVEDTPTFIKVLGNDTFEGDDKLVSLDTNNGPANGTVSVNPDGSVTYTPNDNYVGKDTFTYVVTSGGVSESTTVEVNVTPVNDAPVAKDDIATTQEDTAVTIDVLSNDTDVDGDKLSLQSASVPEAQGKVEIVDGKLVFTPAENFNGDAEIIYTVTDGQLADEAKVTVTVNPVNDAPTIKVDAVESITEDAVSTDTVVATLTVRDTDTPEDQLTVSLENNSNGYFVLVGNEVKLTQTGVDAVNNDELNLKNLTISASVSDGVNPTASDSDSLVVNRVNDAPTVENAIADQVLSEDFASYTIDLNDAFKDSDSALNFSVSGNSNVLVSIENGIATISPTADWNGSETLTFTATDPSGESVSQTVNFTVAPVADIVADKTTVVEDTPTIIKVLGNDTFEGDDKVVSLDTNNGPANGTVSVNPDGSVTYTPNDNYHGADSFTYIVTSGGVSESTTVNVDVTPVNDAPVAKDDIATTQEDTAVTIDVLPNDTDIDGDTLRIDSASVPKEQGTVEVVNGKLVFTPAENFNGDAEITYTVTDGALTDQATVKVTVNAVNDTPVVESNIADQALAEDFTPYTIDLNTAFSDVDNVDGELTFSVSGNSNIQVAIVNGIATITPTADWNGSETLTFTATDPSGESISQTVNFTVAPVADIVADKATVVEDTPTIIKVLGNDTFEGDGKVVSLDTNNGPANGTVSVNPDGSVTYTPNDNYHGADSFTYIVTSGGVSESTTVNVDVTPVNDAPVAKDDIATTQEDTAVTIDVLPNDTDVDGDKLSIQSASAPEAQGKVEIVDGKLVFTPAENFNGDAEITYTVTDGQLTDEAKVTVTVNPVNDAPTIKVDAVESITEDAVSTDTVVATLEVADTDTPEDQLTVSLENNSNGYFVLVGDEVKLTQAGVDAVNNDELNLKDLTISASVSDGVNPTANDSDSLVVNRVNDAPTVENAIADQELSEDFDVYTIDLNEVFKDSDSSLKFSVSGNDNIQISIVNGVATITPTADWNGKETITFTAKDPSGESVNQTVDFTVAPVVDIEADSADVVEDTPTIINVLGNDTFESTDKLVSLDAENGPKNGTVIVNNDGTVTYTPDDNYVGKDTFTYVVTSGGVSESTTVEVNVTPVNDAPVAKDDTAITDEDTPVTIDVLPNDNDIDGDKLSIQSASVPEAQGKVEIVDGKLVFTPAENFNGQAEITYTVTDGQLTDEAKVTVTVNPVNDAPTIKVDAVESITEDAVNTDTVVATLTVRDTDTPEDQLTVSLENNSNGYFVLVGNEVKLTQAGVDAVNNDELNLKDLTISASVSDGVNPTANDSDSLIVNRVNDAPTVENAIADQELSEDFATYTIDLNDAFKDSDSALNFSVSGNSNVLVSIENGIATISPTADWNGSETLTFTATDPSGESVSQTVDFTVAPVVDIKADSTNVVEDTPTIINVLGNDTFEGKDKVVSLDAENGPKNGTVIVNNDGTVTYTPDDNYVGKDTFTYVVTSGGVSESTTVTVNVTPVNDKPESEDFTHVADDQLTQVVFDTDTKPLGSGDSKDHIADVEDDLKGNDLHVRITELPTSGTLFFKDSDGELHEIKEVSDTLYDKDSLYYEADNVGFLLGIKDRPNTPNGSESTSDFNNWGLSEDGGASHSRIEHLANGASITISSDSGELAQYNRQVSHIGNGIADNDGQGIEKGETITVDLSNNPVGSVNLGLDGLGGLFDYGDDNAALITVTYLDSNNVQQTQTFEFLKPEGNFMLFQETSVGYGKDLALPEGSVITQLDFSTKNEGNWELRYVEGVPAEDSFGYVAVDSESGVSDPSTVNIVNEMLDGNVAENGPAVQSITGVTVVEGDNVTFSVSLNNATDQTVKYQVDFSAEGSSTSSQDIDLSNATFTNGVKYLGGYLIVPAGVNGFDITIPSIDDQVVESTESLVIKVGDVSGVGYIDDNDVPPTVQSNEISGLEDEAIVITLEHLGVVDSEVSVEFDTSALNGSLQVKGSDGWEVVSGSVLASDIESGLVRYVPAEHESGADVFDKDGVGNGLDTYEQIHFTVSDGNSSASGTLSIDIEPVADPVKIDLTFGPVTSVPVTLGGSWSTDEELKDLLEASNLPGLDFEHVVTQMFNNGHAGNDLMLSGDTESPLSFVGDQQAGANVDAQGSDIFVTGGGNDSIYGGIGSLDDQAETDTVVYSGKLSDYDFSYYPASDHSEVPYWIVEDSRFIDTKDVVSSTHKESGDHLYEIEQLIFQDAIIKLDNNTGEYVVLTEQQVSFELNLDLIDVDGSESFINDSVTLTGIPSGLTLEVNGKTVTENSDGSYTVDLSSEPNQTSHQLSGTITVPADYNGALDFDVTATAGSVEVNNNTQMGADTASVSVRDYEFVSGTHGDNNIVGSDDNDVIVGDVQGLQIVEGQDYNIAFMLDTSGSMGYDVGRAVTELKTVLNTLIESASGPHSGKVNVLLTTFSTESKQVLELDLSSDNAKSQVESILDAIVKRGDGNTNYEAGFQSALNWFDSADSGATNLSYFISDGRPNQATVNDANNINQMDSIVLGVENNKLVTLADVLPADYKTGDVVTYDNKTVIDSNSLVYSLSTGELLGKMTSNHSYYDYETYVLHQANNAYQALEELSEVRSIGLGHDLDEDSLKHFDSDGVVRTNIDVNQLAEVILGKEVSLMQGKDEISSLDGNDIIFGDAIRFDINGEQGVSALQNYVASQLGKDVALVTKEEVHHYITENQAEFEQSRYYDQADTIYGGAGNDILFGQGGNDKLFGGADNDILIGGLGSDILTGGDGEDIFKWIDVANERDTVTDFSSSEDSLDFSDLFEDLSKDEVGDLLSDLQSGSHTGDAGGYHVEVSQDGSTDTNLSITKGSSTLDIHFNSASVDDITQHLIASLDSQYKDM